MARTRYMASVSRVMDFTSPPALLRARSSVSEMRSRSFVTTLRAKGLSEPAIMRHVLRNSFPTLLTVAGLQFGYLMGGSTMVETIFSWPGIGSLDVSSP